LIWLVVIAVVVVAGGSFLVSKSWMTRGIVAALALMGAGTYWFMGRPAMGDLPYTAQLEKIDAKIKTKPDDLTAAEAMAYLQKRAKDDPKDPTPHKFMGDLYAQANMTNDAILAYQAALRRDPNNIEALTKLGDVLFLSSQKVDESTLGIYRRVLELQPDNVRIGILVGVGEWQAGDKAGAQARWDAILAPLPADSQLRGMYAAMREAFAPEEPKAGETPKSPENKSPSKP
jgi:cytochrome c-type biogenesis protein CcmH/NrfG